MGDKSVAVYMFAQTVGVRPRQKSTAQRICFCPQCAVSLAMGMPPEGALNMAAWDMIRDLVSAEPSLNQAAWESLRGIVGLLTSGHDDPSIRELALSLAQGPSIALGYIKRNINNAEQLSLEACFDGEAMHHTRAGETADHKEAANAFVEKRKPAFQGQ